MSERMRQVGRIGAKLAPWVLGVGLMTPYLWNDSPIVGKAKAEFNEQIWKVVFSERFSEFIADNCTDDDSLRFATGNSRMARLFNDQLNTVKGNLFAHGVTEVTSTFQGSLATIFSCNPSPEIKEELEKPPAAAYTNLERDGNPIWIRPSLWSPKKPKIVDFLAEVIRHELAHAFQNDNLRTVNCWSWRREPSADQIAMFEPRTFNVPVDGVPTRWWKLLSSLAPKNVLIDQTFSANPAVNFDEDFIMGLLFGIGVDEADIQFVTKMLIDDNSTKLISDTLKLFEISKSPEKWKKLLKITDHDIELLKKFAESEDFKNNLALTQKYKQKYEQNRDIRAICAATGLSILAIMTLLQFVIVPAKRKKKR